MQLNVIYIYLYCIVYMCALIENRQKLKKYINMNCNNIDYRKRKLQI